MSDNVLDAENWKFEAQAVINDIKNHVETASISSKIVSTNEKIYVNIRTIEGEDFCLELSALGFRVCGNQPDTINEPTSEYYETPYGLLNVISPKFRESFGNLLVTKLSELQNKQ
ncbi:GSK3-beta interaction protein-like [Onthophagus taurus]|uniref:GSK3-beta interaction protein-like n=1 Tax=Onthophagus taurus TaxID=166361 RepID=UPI000C20690A|nr:GSK3-beta interaction protein-like [Onthophagus taurus]